MWTSVAWTVMPYGFEHMAFLLWVWFSLVSLDVLSQKVPHTPASPADWAIHFNLVPFSQPLCNTVGGFLWAACPCCSLPGVASLSLESWWKHPWPHHSHILRPHHLSKDWAFCHQVMAARASKSIWVCASSALLWQSSKKVWKFCFPTGFTFC